MVENFEEKQNHDSQLLQIYKPIRFCLQFFTHVAI